MLMLYAFKRTKKQNEFPQFNQPFFLGEFLSGKHLKENGKKESFSKNDNLRAFNILNWVCMPAN